MFSQILNKLKEKLQTISDIKSIYVFEPKEISAYPSVVIIPETYQDNYLALGRIDREYVFRIRVLHYVENTNDLESAQNKIINLVDSILDVLNSNPSLDGVIDFSLLTRGSFKFVERAGLLYICEMEYIAKKTKAM